MTEEQHSRISHAQAWLIGAMTGLLLLLPAITQLVFEVCFFRFEDPFTAILIGRREIVDTLFAFGPRAIFFLALCGFLGWAIGGPNQEGQSEPRAAAEAVRIVTICGAMALGAGITLAGAFPALRPLVFGEYSPPVLGLGVGALLGLFGDANELDKRNTLGGRLIWWLCRVPAPPEPTASERVSQRRSWWKRVTGSEVFWLAVCVLLYWRADIWWEQAVPGTPLLIIVVLATVVVVGARAVLRIAAPLYLWRRKRRAAVAATTQADDEQERLEETAPPGRREALLGVVALLDVVCAKKQAALTWQAVLGAALGALTALAIGSAPVIVGSITSFIPKLHVLLGKGALAYLPKGVQRIAESGDLLEGLATGPPTVVPYVNLTMVGIYLGVLAGMGALWGTTVRLDNERMPSARDSIIAGSTVATMTLLGALAAGLFTWSSPILGPFYAAFGGGGLLAWLTAILACVYGFSHTNALEKAWTRLSLLVARLVLVQPPAAQLQASAPEEPVSSNRLALIGAVTALLALLIPTAIAGWGWMHPELVNELGDEYQLAIGSLAVHSRITLVLGWLAFTVLLAGLLATMRHVPGEVEGSPASLRSLSVGAVNVGMYATAWAIVPFLFAATFIPALRYYVFGPMGT